MIKELTLELAHSLVEKAIALKGEDYVYKPSDVFLSCTYVDAEEVWDGEDYVDHLKPGCIVGLAILPQLPELDLDILSGMQVNESPAGAFLDWLRNSGYIASDVPVEVVDYLWALQNSQDNKRPWGEAHREAKRGFTWSEMVGEYRPQNY